jgi:hypothetical protein
LHLVSGLEM